MVNREELNLTAAKNSKSIFAEADKSKVFFTFSWLALHLVVLSFTIFKLAG